MNNEQGMENYERINFSIQNSPTESGRLVRYSLFNLNKPFSFQFCKYRISKPKSKQITSLRVTMASLGMLRAFFEELRVTKFFHELVCLGQRNTKDFHEVPRREESISSKLTQKLNSNTSIVKEFMHELREGNPNKNLSICRLN